jgi:hypothetical protein
LKLLCWRMKARDWSWSIGGGQLWKLRGQSIFHVSNFRPPPSNSRLLYQNRCLLFQNNSENIGNILLFFFRHLKDLILLTAIVQVLSIISHYFWILWLLVGNQYKEYGENCTLLFCMVRVVLSKQATFNFEIVNI